MAVERRDQIVRFEVMQQPIKWEESVTESKSYQIDKQVVWEAYCKVKAKKGAAGVDNQTMEDFERNLKDNLYKIWNRMSSGSYFPPAVLSCEIPKANGKTRTLGIPTVADRIAQMVVKMYLEPKVEPKFHQDSYGYRPGKSAHQAIGKARARCWNYDWVIDMDIKEIFDDIDHDRMLREVQKYTQEKWILLYIERWLKAPAQKPNGEIEARSKGTPQGGVISPLLANIFLHEVNDEWMQKVYPTLRFERYADDIVVHCQTEKQAKYVLESIRRRMQEYGLTVHPEKTKIVYCGKQKSGQEYEHTSFDFLGYTFQSRLCRSKTGKYFVGFVPAVSVRAKQAMSQKIKGWKLKEKVSLTLEAIAERINQQVRGWMNYYGKYYRSAMHPILGQVEKALVGWANRKYKKLRRKFVAVMHWLRTIWQRKPQLFAHWAWKIRETER